MVRKAQACKDALIPLVAFRKTITSDRHHPDYDRSAYEIGYVIDSLTRMIADDMLSDSGIRAMESIEIEGFGEYKDFDACVIANKDKDDPKAYCATIETNFKVAAKKKKLKESFAQIDLSLVEAGARLSKSTRDSLTGMISALQALMGAKAEQTEETPAEDQVSDDELKATESAIRDEILAWEQLKADHAAAPAIAPVVESAALRPVSISESSGRMRIYSPAFVISEASRQANGAAAFDMLMIKEGKSLNKVRYRESVLRTSIPLFEGRPLYVNHPPEARGSGSLERGLESKAGWWENIRYETGIKTKNGTVDGLVGTLNLFSRENSPQPWLEGMIRESLAVGRPDLVGVSILAGGEGKIARDSEGVYREVDSITAVYSVDAVAEPGAAGQPLAIIAASIEVDKDIMTLEEILAAIKGLPADQRALALKEANITAEDIKALGIEIPVVQPVVTPPATPTPMALREEDQKTLDNMTSTLEAMRAANSKMALNNALRESELPESVQTIIREEVGTQVLDEDAISAIVKRYQTVSAAAIGVVAESTIPLRAIIPFGSTSVGLNELDQCVLALEDMFGIPNAEQAGKYHKITSIREAYIAMTGDAHIDGIYDLKHSVLRNYLFREGAGSLPGATHVIGGGTITMGSLINNTCNKALIKKYRDQDLWWQPIVSKQPLNDFKTQTRVRLNNFGSLTERTVDGEEYTELDWEDSDEDYTPTEYGNVVSIGRRAIINDDLRGISRIPALLARSAGITINEYVAALFLANSGNGPALNDGVQIFNAASHQGNRGTDPLSRSAVIAGRTVLRKMTDNASKRVGFRARFLLVPEDLEALGWELITSMKVPESANNAPNILSDAQRGLSNLITVPQFTDTNNWYLFPSPEEVENIEMGFLFGREDPELFLQDNPLTGAVFTHDVIMHKIRHDYGGGWLDYRAYASIVA